MFVRTENSRAVLTLKVAAALIRQISLRAQLRQGRQPVFRPEALDDPKNFPVEKVVRSGGIYPLVIHHDIPEVDLLTLR